MRRAALALALSIGLVVQRSAPAAAEPPAPAETRAYTLVVANNLSADGSLARLRYADDDGARWTELFELFAERTELLTVLDEDSQRIHGALAARTLPPSRRQLDASLTSLFAAIEEDNRAGRRTVFYFVFIGHGSVGEDGEGAVHLLDARFSRSDLFHEVIARSPARVNHVIIDACNAYTMVARRGGTTGRDAEIESAIRGFVGREGLERYPNTGVLLSTSRAAEVHEWSRFEAGIFSHEVRSALAGAADVDGDGVVRYDEARAFVGAANAQVLDAKARLEAYAAPPAFNAREPLFDRGALRRAAIIRVPSTFSGHRWLEDARGVRYADFNLALEQSAVIAVVPSSEYHLHGDGEEVRLPVELFTEVDAGAFPRVKAELALRGSEAISFQRDLFAMPFGRAYFEGFRASLALRPEAELAVPPSEGGPGLATIAAGGLAVGAVAALAAALVVGDQASQRAETYRSAIGTTMELEALRAESASAATTANVLLATGGSLALGAALVWLLADPQ